jgi:Domain of unknown function (DUF4160)
MPTVLRAQGCRLLFYSLENDEPPHIHIERDEKVAKYWLNPVTLAMNGGFRSHELTKLRELVVEHRNIRQEAWDADLGN